jgi:hypothetical protein
MIKRNSIGAIDTHEEKKAVSYCRRCAEFGLNKPLGERIYQPDEFGNLVIPSDHDLWRQCHYCGTVYPKYEAKEESIIEPFVTVSDNPFDVLNSKMKAVEQRGGKRGSIRQDKKTVQYKDEDVNRALKKGGKILSYSER